MSPAVNSSTSNKAANWNNDAGCNYEVIYCPRTNMFLHFHKMKYITFPSITVTLQVKPAKPPAGNDDVRETDRRQCEHSPSLQINDCVPENSRWF